MRKPAGLQQIGRTPRAAGSAPHRLRQVGVGARVLRHRRPTAGSTGSSTRGTAHETARGRQPELQHREASARAAATACSSRQAASGLWTLRMPKAIVAASTAPSASGRRVASPCEPAATRATAPAPRSSPARAGASHARSRRRRRAPAPRTRRTPPAPRRPCPCTHRAGLRRLQPERAMARARQR